MRQVYYFFKITLLFICFVIAGLSCRAEVEKWQRLGPGLINQPSTDSVLYTTLAKDNNDDLYLAYISIELSNKVTVRKYDHIRDNWETVGIEGFSAAGCRYTCVAVNASGTPYVAFADGANGGRATVMKYNGTAWIVVGAAGFTAGGILSADLKISNTGTLYFAYTTSDNRVAAMKNSGTGWAPMGTGIVSAGKATGTALALNASGTPYVVYSDSANGNRATVMKYDGTNWVSAGKPGFSTEDVDYTCIAIDKNGTPYVFYQDYATTYFKGTCMKLVDTTWVVVGTPGFTLNSGADHTSIAIDTAGNPFIVYNSLPNYGHAMWFTGTTWKDYYAYTSLYNNFYDLNMYNSVVVSAENVPYVAYSNVSRNRLAIVEAFNNESQFGTWWETGMSGKQMDYGAPGKYKYDSAGINLHEVIVVNDTAYTYFADAYDGGISVLKYNGENWVSIGTCVKGLKSIKFVRMVVDRAGTPYVAFWETNSTGIIKFKDGKQIKNSLPPGLPQCFSIDSNDVPYIVVSAIDGKTIKVYKFNGSQWLQAGNTISSVNIPGFFVKMAFDRNNIPYITYMDLISWQYDNELVVKKLEGGSWVKLNSPRQYNWYNQAYAITFDSANDLYLAYGGSMPSNQDPIILVVRYDTATGEWIQIGSPNMGSWDLGPIIFDKDHTIYMLVTSFRIPHGFFGIIKYDGYDWTLCSQPGEGYATSMGVDSKGKLYVAGVASVNVDDVMIPLRGSRWGYSYLPTPDKQNIYPPDVSYNLCFGATPQVWYTARGQFEEGNIFTAELSDSNGYFDHPDTIGITKSTTSGIINCHIPKSLMPKFESKWYRIRVVSSLPYVESLPDSNWLSVSHSWLVADAGPDRTISNCDPTVKLGAKLTGRGVDSLFFTYDWSSPQNLDSATRPNPTVISQSKATTYIVTLSHTWGGCYTTDTVTVYNYNINLPVQVSIDNHMPDTICSGNTVQFEALASNRSDSVLYTWKVNGSIVQNGHSPFYTANSLQNTDTVTCLLTSFVCGTQPYANSNAIVMTVDREPLVPVITEQVPILCSGGTGTYKAASENASSYLWTFPSGFTIDSGQGTTSVRVSVPALTDSAIITAKAINNCGNTSANYTIKCTVATGEEESREAAGLIIYPNPATTQFAISVTGFQPKGITVYDVNGHKLSEQNFSPYLNIDNLTSGIYLVVVSDGKVVSRSRFVKM